jgi:hypothetical protein
MGKRIFGWVLFAWMAIATVGALGDIRQHGGVRFGTELAAAIVCCSLAALGLVLALGKSKPPTEPKQ